MLYKTVRFLYSIKFHKKYQPADRLRNIFDNERKEIIEQVIIVPFFTTKQEGTGIGLSLSRQIMRLHNGTLTLTRSDATGTVFTLIFR